MGKMTIEVNKFNHGFVVKKHKMVFSVVKNDLTNGMWEVAHISRQNWFKEVLPQFATIVAAVEYIEKQ